MATSAEKFSTGYKGKKAPPRRKKPAPPKTEVDGPYRSQSSVPAVRKKATRREHRKVAPPPSPKELARQRHTAAALAALAVKPPSLKGAREGERMRRIFHHALAPLGGGSRRSAPKVATLTAAGSTTGKSFKPDAISLAVERDVIDPLQKEGKLPEHPTTGQQIYQKIAEYGPTVLTLGPEVKAGTAALKAALSGAESEGVTVGGSKVLSKVLSPTKATTAEERAAVAARAQQSAARAEATGVKAAARRGAARLTRSEGRANRAVARQVAGTPTRREAAAAAGAPLKLTKAAASQTLPVVRGHEQALLEHPKTTLKTTARAIPGLVTAPVGIAAEVGVSAGRAGSAGLHAAGVPGFRAYSGSEIAAPIVGEAKAQLEFARQVAQTITSSDPAEVQEEVEDNLGLTLPIMLGLGTKAVGEKITRGRVTDAVRKIVEQARERVGRGHGQHGGQTPRVFERSGQRKREAVRTANARSRIRQETHARSRRVRMEAGKAKGSEVVRRGVTRGGRLARRKGDLTIHTGDVVGFVVRHALPLDKPAEALAEVKRIKSTLKPLPEGVSLPADALSTRDVIGFIERHPHVLADKHLARTVAAYKEQARYARETPGLSPEHSERARFTSTAVTRGVPLSDERFPNSVRDEIRATPTPGRQAKDVLRREARGDRARARKLRRKAATRAGRAKAIRRELAVRERAEPTRVKTNARITALAARMESQARTYLAGADRAEAMAKRKQKAATEIDPAVTDEFVKEMQATLRREGKPEPEYVHTGRAREAPTYGATGAKLTQFPGASKFRKGSAETYGLVQEGLAPTLRESIARPVSRRESYKAMRGFLDDNEFRVGNKNEWTSNEARQLFEDGVVNRDNYVLVPRQLYKRAYSPEEWAGHLKLALDTDPADALKPGRRFKIVRRPAAKEFFDQMGAELVSGKLAAFNRATSFLILGTSPAWAAAQVVAEYAQAAVAQPKLLNPAFVRKAIKGYEDMAPHKRQAFDSWVGVTSRTLEGPGDLKLDLTTGDMQAAADAYGVLNTTPLGRVIKSIPQGLRNLDQWKGGRIRVLTTAAKVDTDLNRRTTAFLRGIRGMHDEIGRASNELKGQPLSRQLEYVAEHPAFERRYQSYLDDVMGNWSALTRNERVASQIMIFYPFVRMSLRWTFYAFPKRHPIKAAIMTYLGQQNAAELKKLLGQDPSFFTGWANVPLHLGPGETKLLPLSRIAPGSNALIEALGENTDRAPGTTALRVAQPAVVSAITAATGVTPLTGKQEPNAGINALAQLLTLSPIGRVANELLVPTGKKRTKGELPIVGSTERQEALDKLFAKLSEARSPAKVARTLIAPAIPRKVAYEKDLGRISNILNTLSENSSTKLKELAEEEAKRAVGRPEGKRRQITARSLKRKARMEALYERASNELDGMFEKYGIPYQREGDEFLQTYGEIFYGSKPKSETTIGGVTIHPRPHEGKGGQTSIGGVPVGKAPEKEEPAPKTQRKQTTIAGVPIS